MSQYTVVVGEFSVAQANALSDGIFLNPVPPLTAWVGLGTALSMRLGPAFALIGIAPIIGEAQLHRGHAKYVRYRAGQLGDVASRGIQHPTVDDRRSSLNAYLLLNIESDELLRGDMIRETLIGLRLAGGIIQPPTGKQAIAVKIYHPDEKLTAEQQAMRALPSFFYVLEDASHLIKAARENNQQQGFDILTAPLRRWSGNETESERQQNLNLPPRPAWLPLQGIYRPMAVGYQLLEAPRLRTGSRNDLLHAFAEPIFSLVRFRTVASARKTHNPETDGSYFWNQGPRADGVLGACPVKPAVDEGSLF